MIYNNPNTVLTSKNTSMIGDIILEQPWLFCGTERIEKGIILGPIF